MHDNQRVMRNLAVITLLMSTILLVFACYMVSWRMGKDRADNVPANTVIQDISGNGGQGSPAHPTVPTVPSTPQPATSPTISPSDQQSTTHTTPLLTTQTTLRQEEQEAFLGRVDCSGRLTVTVPAANVREDADKDARLVTVIHEGESYDVIGQKCSSTGILWYEIRTGETTGYVAGSYVRYDGKVIGGKAYLTFDDGPTENTWRILDILDRYGAKATFFVIYHSGQENTYRAIVERGHTIALHSYTHSYKTIYSGVDDFFADLSRLDEYVYGLTGVHSKIIRFPGGTSNTISRNYCKGVMTDISAEAHRRGYRYYDWDVDSGDADDVTVPEKDIIQNIKDGVGNRRHAIILMHDAQAKTTTADALPEIIEFLQGKGYELAPITESTPEMHQPVFN